MSGRSSLNKVEENVLTRFGNESVKRKTKRIACKYYTLLVKMFPMVLSVSKSDTVKHTCWNWTISKWMVMVPSRLLTVGTGMCPSIRNEGGMIHGGDYSCGE